MIMVIKWRSLDLVQCELQPVRSHDLHLYKSSNPHSQMADMMLSKLPEKLDIDDALPEMFEPDEKGRINSLSTVLSQEIIRFNKLLAVSIKLKHSLQ